MLQILFVSILFLIYLYVYIVAAMKIFRILLLLYKLQITKRY